VGHGGGVHGASLVGGGGARRIREAQAFNGSGEGGYTRGETPGRRNPLSHSQRQNVPPSSPHTTSVSYDTVKPDIGMRPF
jgi:hypothetical protein